MAGLLTGKIAKAIFKGFKGKLLTGELRHATPSSGNDEFGDPSVEVLTYRGIEGFTDKYSDSYRAKAGIPETDLLVAIFEQSSPGIIPAKDDKVRFGSTWYQLRKIGVDPAGALYECQAFVVPAPFDTS